MAPTGRGTCTTVPAARSGPALATVMLKVPPSPTDTGDAVWLTVTDRSLVANGVTSWS